ncbi:MAG: hypothetical protein M3N98_09630 [Actinomycetota bacterium]|nr:hypothetical protein [Actinomycetota bacterium]
MNVLPWPRPKSVEGREVAEWTLETGEDVGPFEVGLIVERLHMADPGLDVGAEIGGQRILTLAFVWATYDGEALSRSTEALRLVSEMVMLARVQGVDRSLWPFLRDQ